MKISSPLGKNIVQSDVVRGFFVLGIISVSIWLGMPPGSGLKKDVIRAKQSEGKTYIHVMNRGQQAYRAESGSFATDRSALEIDMPKQMKHYVYSIMPSANSVDRVTHLAIPRQADLRSYIGEVAVTSRGTTVAIVCESKQPSQVAPLIPEFANDSLVCAPGSREYRG